MGCAPRKTRSAVITARLKVIWIRWEERLGPHRSEIAAPPRSAGREDIVRFQQQEGVKRKQSARALKATLLYVTYEPQ